MGMTQIFIPTSSEFQVVFLSLSFFPSSSLPPSFVVTVIFLLTVGSMALVDQNEYLAV
jgi:hypothetical protein